MEQQLLPPFPFERLITDKKRVSHYVASISYAKAKHALNGDRVMREVAQNWIDEVVGKKKEGSARAKRENAAGRPILKRTSYRGVVIYLFHGENNVEYIYGELWHILAGGSVRSKDGDIYGPAVLTLIPHATDLRVNHLCRIGSTTKSDKAENSAVTGVNGEGAKIAALDAMRMGWKLEYTSKSFYVNYKIILKSSKNGKRQDYVVLEKQQREHQKSTCGTFSPLCFLFSEFLICYFICCVDIWHTLTSGHM